MAIKITEDGAVRYVNENDVDRTMFPNLDGAMGDEQYDALNGRLTVVEGKVSDLEECCGDVNNDITELNNNLNQKADKSEALSAYIIETATGSIASFTDGADNVPVKDLTVAIEPVQSGSGDPSPSNVRPISGWTGANVTRTGKNLLVLNEDEMTSEGWYKIFPFTIKSGTYNISCSSVFANGTGAVVELLDSVGERIKQIVTSYAWGSSGQTTDNYSFTLTDAEAQNVEKIIFKFNAGGTVFSDIVSAKLMIESGSTATAYEPYQSETYEVDWTTEAGTVYGGTLDVTTGVLTVDRAAVDLGTLEWIKDTNRTSVFYAYVATKAEAKTGAYIDENWLICDTYKYINESVTTKQDKYVSDYPSYGGKIIFARDTTYTESAEFNTGVSGHYVAYKLATPQTYQLTPQEVSTILGQNNIFADCGDVTVQYRADTKLYIDKVVNA